MLQVLVAISQSFVAEKIHGAMQKLFIRKREKKMDTCPNYQNNGYGDARLKKKEKRDE